MAKATRPVTVAGIAFDALLEEEYVFSADAPEYPVEDEFTVSDTIILKPLILSMTLYVSDMPVTWENRGHGGNGWTDQVLQRLENLYFSKETVTVVTSSKTYRNMAIQSISISKAAGQGSARAIPISFKEIRTVRSRTTTVPASYRRSGESGANAGTASVTASPTPPSNKSNSGSSGSILYNLATSAGLLR